MNNCIYKPMISENKPYHHRIVDYKTNNVIFIFSILRYNWLFLISIIVSSIS